ncbi:hypothetical protein [Streptomyces sp. NPDC059080]|uniref:hypothetical protein n=1 Tax=Streptomyces sp. NPDC059080 TaxID=3346718 RepID=UPI00369DA2F4
MTQDNSLREMRVCLDVGDAPTYLAKVNLAVRWNGWLNPRFPLSEVRRMAEYTQADLARGDEVDTVHVIDRAQIAGGTYHEGAQPVVLHVRWMFLGEAGPKAAVEVIEPDEAGLYWIGGNEWAWTED